MLQPKDRVAAVLALRAEGLTINQIRARLRIGYNTVREIVADPEGAKARAALRLSVTCSSRGNHITAPPLPPDRASIDLQARVARVLASGERIRPRHVNPYHITLTSSPAGQCADVGGGEYRGRPW
jgi:hypothetical protein